MDMSKYKKMFVEEAREHLEAAGQHLVALEKTPSDETLINELFRSAHSIKGMAASLGYEGITELAHTLEDFLDLCRGGALPIDPPTIDLLLRGIDFLEKMVGEVDADEPVSDPSPLSSEVRAAMAGAQPSDEAAADETAVAPEPEMRQASSGEARPRIRMRVSFRVAPDSVSPGARGFLAVRSLEALGSVENIRPPIATIKSGRYGRVVDADLETENVPEEIARSLGAIPEIIEVRVQPSTRRDRGTTNAGAGPDGEASAAGRSSTVRVKTEALDRFVDAVGELILNKAELRELARELGSEALQQGLSRMEASLEELKRHAMGIRLTPLERVFGSLPRMVRDIARSRGKQVELEIRGGALELDRAVVDALNDPLIHLLRNAVDHGVEEPGERTKAGKPEEGRILVEAYREKDLAVIHVEDDGHGIDVSSVREAAVARGLCREDEVASLDDQAVFSLLFRPGMSTATEVSDVSGRGVGLDAVKTAVQSLGGTVSMDSRPERGTQFTLRIPFSAAILRVLIIRVGEEMLAVPIAKVYRALEIDGSELMGGTKSSGARWFCRVEGGLFPAWTLAELLAFSGPDAGTIDPNSTYRVIVADIRQGRAALIVDGFVGEEEVFVKPLGRPLSGQPTLAGITVLGSGHPVLVLDPYGVGPDVRLGGEEREQGEERLGE